MEKDKENKEEQFIKENSMIFKKYKVQKKLGEGAFGDVYSGICIENNEAVAIKVESSNSEPIVKSFSFDELSKSISEELNKLKLEEEKELTNNETKEDNIPEVNITKFDELASKVEISEPVFITEGASIKKEDEIVLPKLAKEEKKEELPEPILKDEEVPLFARFNQETYEINKKD